MKIALLARNIPPIIGLTIGVIVVAYACHYSLDNRSSFILLGVSICVLSAIIFMINVYDWLNSKNAPFSFNYEKELSIYLHVCRNIKKQQTTNSMINNYTDWKEHIKKNFKELTNTEYENDNIFHYFISLLRVRIVNRNLLVYLIIPIEIGVIATFCSALNTHDFIVTAVMAILIGFVLTIILYIAFLSFSKEVYFVKDLIYVLYPDGNVKEHII